MGGSTLVKSPVSMNDGYIFLLGRESDVIMRSGAKNLSRRKSKER